MARKIFVSYSHKLNQTAAEAFRLFFSDQRDVYIDKSIREDVGSLTVNSNKSRLRGLIKDSSVTIVLIGSETGGRWWVDWEIYNSLRSGDGNSRNALLGIRIKHKQHWVPPRLDDNVPAMGHIIDWP